MSHQASRAFQVLLVEDDPGDAGLIRNALKDKRIGSFEETWVTSLGEAREIMDAVQFDVVLLDLSLPDSQGLETVRGGLEAARDMPVVVLTGRDDEELALRILEMGAQDYLVKGRHDADALLRALRHALARARTERALRRSEALLSGILDNTLDAVWSATWPDFQVIFVSRSIENIFGWPQDVFQSNPRLWFESIVPEDRPVSESGLKKLLSEGCADVEYRVRKPSGEMVWVRERSKVIFRPMGGPERVDGVFTDVTRQREAEQKLAQKPVDGIGANPSPNEIMRNVAARGGNMTRTLRDDRSDSLKQNSRS
ncbi:response regulator [Desulfonatronum thioautotrophicum]|uniref:response regulator n=1 Tax=Desulfonatronum thioautotrophicum TaxID=617001 RepID=UPI00069A9FBA|nr:response regulator [Desulfonatronum thioautotrophicum]